MMHLSFQKFREIENFTEMQMLGRLSLTHPWYAKYEIYYYYILAFLYCVCVSIKVLLNQWPLTYGFSPPGQTLGYQIFQLMLNNSSCSIYYDCFKNYAKVINFFLCAIFLWPMFQYFLWKCINIALLR